MVIVIVCHTCKEYLIIHPENPISKQEEDKFCTLHHKHMINRINIVEITEKYKCVNKDYRGEH